MAPHGSKPMTYKGAGVDIDAGEAMVTLIAPMVRRTFTPRVLDGFGGFAGAFRLDFREKLLRRDYKNPVLVACTDSVGTKVLIGIAMKKLDTVGVDCVAMCVNDLICTGGEPLFFLDYLGVNRLGPERMAEIVRGVAAGCSKSGCALLGGETAEMPDLYKTGDFDLAGFAVGVVERRRMLSNSRVALGDVAIGLASDGIHSNGFGLARKALLGREGFELTDRPPSLEGASVGQELLRPTRIYVKPVLEILKHYRVKHVVKAMAHITGGGLPGNLPRVLPEGMTVRVKRGSWQVPAIFKLIARKGPVDPIEMMRVFNMGVGFVMIVAPYYAKAIMNRLRRMGERAWVLGKVRKGGPELVWA
ncbi:MAG: phosphoribosylformylglycinamidine cyclo-ligase [Phycisphaerae bacterium]|nr:phosphoribosylformylglycinamidine cyclo-ligase [Phycisphaerae bacterium]